MRICGANTTEKGSRGRREGYEQGIAASEQLKKQIRDDRVKQVGGRSNCPRGDASTATLNRHNFP